MSTAIPTSVLMCHAPIVLPPIGGQRAEQCTSSTQAMQRAASHVVAFEPDAVVIASPHAPRHPQSWLLAGDPRVQGTFGQFGVPDVGAEVPFAAGATEAVDARAQRLGLQSQVRELGSLDHGTLVPLWFLVQAGWQGPTARIALPMEPDHEQCDTMGQAIARAAADRGERWAVVASGDMSHRLTPDAPAGYDPRAQEFDDAVRGYVDAGDYRGVRHIDPKLRQRAGEDVIDTLEVAAGATGNRNDRHETLSYEGPFGVGYLVAILHSSGPPN